MKSKNLKKFGLEFVWTKFAKYMYIAQSNIRIHAPPVDFY